MNWTCPCGFTIELAEILRECRCGKKYRLAVEFGSPLNPRRRKPKLIPKREPVQKRIILPCAYRGEETGDKVDCGCGGRGQAVPVFQCQIHGKCLTNSPGTTKWKGAICIICDEQQDP